MSARKSDISIIQYDRNKALKYAHDWALKRNSKYYDFSSLGGDCTNFCSQVLYAGSNVMNYAQPLGWFYINGNNKAAAWTGVNFFYNFLTRNKTRGPFARQVEMAEIIPGDFIQLSFHGDGRFNHSLVVVEKKKTSSADDILIATHTIDRDYYPLSNYKWKDIRFLHIEGVYR